MPPVTEPKDAFDQDQASGSQLAISGSQMRIMYHVFQLHESERCLDLSIILKGVGHLCWLPKKGFHAVYVARRLRHFYVRSIIPPLCA